MPPSSPRGASSGRHDGSSTGLQAPRPEVPRAAGSSPADRRSAPGISRSCPFLAPGTGRSRGPAAPPASSARAKPSDPASKRRAGSTHFGRYSHLWEPNPVLFRDPSVQAPMPLSAPPASSSRVLTLLGVWRRRGRHGGRSSSVNGAERHSRKAAASSRARARGLDTQLKGTPRQQGESPSLNDPSCTRPTATDASKDSGEETPTGPWNPGRPPAG